MPDANAYAMAVHARVRVCVFICVCVCVHVCYRRPDFARFARPNLPRIYMGRVTYVIPGYLNARQIVRDDVIVCAGWRRLILDTDVESAFHRRT